MRKIHKPFNQFPRDTFNHRTHMVSSFYSHCFLPFFSSVLLQKHFQSTETLYHLISFSWSCVRPQCDHGSIKSWGKRRSHECWKADQVE